MDTTVDHQSLAKTTLSGTLWMYAAMYSSKFINVISLAILARLLLQEDFGIANFALVFVSMIDFPGLGIGPALVYHDKDGERTNAGFWSVIMIGLLLTAATYAIAPLVGAYFQDARAVPVVQVFSVYFLFTAFGVVPSSLLSKNLSFKLKFIPDFSGSVSKAVVSISMALMGFGAWSLIAGNLMNTLIATLVLWLVWRTGWRPSFRFNLREALSLLKYASSIIAIYLLSMLLVNLDQLLIGRYLGAAALGVYALGFRIPELLIKQFYVAISQVLFPVFTRVKSDIEVLGQGFLVSLRYILMISAPVAVGLALVARPVVLLIFGEKWVEAVPVLAAISVYTLFYSLDFNSGNLFMAQGRPDIIPRIQFVNLLVSAPVLFWTVIQYKSILAVAGVQVALAIVMGTARLVVAAHLLKIPKRDIFLLFRPLLASTAIMALGVSLALRLVAGASPLLQLLVTIPTGAFLYGVSLWMLERETVLQAITVLRSAITKRSA